MRDGPPNPIPTPKKPPQKIELQVTPAAIGSKILVDGQEMRNVRRAELILDPKQASVLKLEIFCLDGATVIGQGYVGAVDDQIVELIRTARELVRVNGTEFACATELAKALRPFAKVE